MRHQILTALILMGLLAACQRDPSTLYQKTLICTDLKTGKVLVETTPYDFIELSSKVAGRYELYRDNDLYSSSGTVQLDVSNAYACEIHNVPK